MQAFLKEHQEELLKLPGFDALHQQFDANVEKLNQLALIQMHTVAGSVALKKQKRQTMTDLTLEVSRRVVAMAMLTGNQVLRTEVKCTLRQMTLSTSRGVADRADIVYKLAEQNKDSLAAYGVDDTVLGLLKISIEEYNEVAGKPRLNIVDRHVATSEITSVFKETVALLQKMDILLAIIKGSNESLHSSYRWWRRITHTGLRHLALKGMVKDATTQSGIEGVTVEFKLLTADNQPVTEAQAKKAKLVKNSGKKGGFLSRRMLEGKYEFTASKQGYVTETRTVFKADGITCKLDIALTKVTRQLHMGHD